MERTYTVLKLKGPGWGHYYIVTKEGEYFYTEGCNLRMHQSECRVVFKHPVFKGLKENESHT